MENERHIQSQLSAKTKRSAGRIAMTERGRTMSLHDAVIGILRETGLVLEQSDILGKNWTEKAWDLEIGMAYGWLS